MKILVTGATGLVGGEIVKQLLASGKHEVVGVVRSDDAAEKLKALGVIPFKGDMTDPEPLAAEAAKCNATLHLAFIHDFSAHEAAVDTDVKLVKAFVKALAGSNKPLIGTQALGLLAPTKGPADESVPPNPELPSPRGKAETIIIEGAKQGMKGMVLRLPSHVWGPSPVTAGASVFAQLAAGSVKKRGEALYVGDGSNVVSVAHVEDVAALYILAMEHGQAGNVYNVAVENITGKGLAEAIQKGLGSKIASVSMDENIEAFGGYVGFMLASPVEGDSSKARTKLGWKPKHTSGFLDAVTAAGKAGSLGW